MALIALVYAVSLATLAVGSTRLIAVAGKAAALFRIPETYIGLSLLALGSVLPELFMALSATARGNPEAVPSIVTGSLMANATVVIAVASLVAPRVIPDRTHRLYLLVFSAAVFSFVIGDGLVTGREGATLVIIAALALTFFFHSPASATIRRTNRMKDYSLLVVGALLLFYFLIVSIAASTAIEAVSSLSDATGANLSSLALVLLGAGAALPELIMALLAFRRRAYGIALGAVIASNVLNATLVLGVPAFITPLPVSYSLLPLGMFSVAAASGMLVLLTFGKGVRRIDMISLLALYVIFIVSAW